MSASSLRCLALAFLALTPALSASAAEKPPASVSLAASVIPPDVLSAAFAQPLEVRARLCLAPLGNLSVAERMEPVLKIEGFTSRMKDDVVAGAPESEEFVRAFGASAVHAFVKQDDVLKRRLITLLSKWSSAGAWLQTESCVAKNGQLKNIERCREWRVPDGSDLSSMKDATFATFLAIGLIRAYYVALADAAPDMAAEHTAIKQWIGKINLRLKRPGDVYFGLNVGWYWPAITSDLSAGRVKQANQKLQALESGLIRLIKDDGSIKDRTTRGDRALWYHHTSIGEIVMSMELTRAAGVPISPKLEKKLHAAVALFVAAIKDEHVLDKWAKEAHNARWAGKQEWAWDNWPNETFAGTWFHVYPYRYPQEPVAKALRELVRTSAQSATQDNDFGLGLGCVYNAAVGQ